MGNYRFRLSDMMPNAWFYKLRDMSKTTRKPNKNRSSNTKAPSSHKSNFSIPRNSTKIDKFYKSPTNPKFSDTHFPDPHRKSKSSKRRTKRKTVYKPSPRKQNPSSVSPDSSTIHRIWQNPETAEDFESISSENDSTELDFLKSPSSCFDSDTFDAPQSLHGYSASWSTSCTCKFSSSATDIIIDMDKKFFGTTRFENIDEFDAISEVDLAPIITKPRKPDSRFIQDEDKTELRKPNSRFIQEEEKTESFNPKTPSPANGKSISRVTGVKIRTNSPKIASKKLKNRGRKSLSGKKQGNSQKNSFYTESFAIVKASFDPEKDFRESMMEMIMENNIKESKDLEELLACYLSLNSDEYHDLIIRAFEQIWFNLSDLHL